MLKPDCHDGKDGSSSIKGHFFDLHNFCLQLNISVGFAAATEGRGTSKFKSQSQDLRGPSAPCKPFPSDVGAPSLCCW